MSRKEELEKFVSEKYRTMGKTSEINPLLNLLHELASEMDLGGEPFQTVLRRICKEDDTDFDETLEQIVELKKELLN